MAVGLANLIQNCLGISTLTGIVATLETYVSQTIGQQNFELCAIYMNRAVFLWFVAIVLYSGIVYNSYSILISVG